MRLTILALGFVSYTMAGGQANGQGLISPGPLNWQDGDHDGKFGQSPIVTQYLNSFHIDPSNGVFHVGMNTGYNNDGRGSAFQIYNSYPNFGASGTQSANLAYQLSQQRKRASTATQTFQYTQAQQPLQQPLMYSNFYDPNTGQPVFPQFQPFQDKMSAKIPPPAQPQTQPQTVPIPQPTGPIISYGGDVVIVRPMPSTDGNEKKDKNLRSDDNKSKASKSSKKSSKKQKSKKQQDNYEEDDYNYKDDKVDGEYQDDGNNQSSGSHKHTHIVTVKGSTHVQGDCKN